MKDMPSRMRERPRPLRTVFLGLVPAVFAGAVLWGCSPAEAPPPTEYGAEHVSSHAAGSRPSWIDDIEGYRKAHKDRVYFVGMAMRAEDLKGGRADAVANAMAQIANAVQSTVHDLYVGARSGNSAGNRRLYTPGMEKAIEAGTLRTARGVITGAGPDRYWWEKIWIQGEPGEAVRYSYNVYVRVSMTKEDYDRTVFQTLNGVGAEVDVPGAGEVIRTMRDLWLGRQGVRFASPATGRRS